MVVNGSESVHFLFIVCLYLYCGWTSNYQKMVWDPINRFNCSILLCLSEARTWISNATCYDLFVFSGLRWKVVDIGGIADQHCFKFLFIILSIYTIRQKLSTTWLVSIISFLIRNLFQIGLLFSLPVHTYLLTCETGHWSIFIYVYMTGCVKCHVYFSTFVFANESWFFLCRVLSFIFYWFGMVRRKLTIPERWQAVGMHNGGFSHRMVADHFRVNHSISVRLMQRFRQTGNVTDHPRAGRPRKTTPRDDRLISRRARQRSFSTAGVLRGNLAFGCHISTRTVIWRLHHQGMRARRPIKRPQLTLRHRLARFDWSHDHLQGRI
jgi:transposase